MRSSTARRLRLEAQGCFNPGIKCLGESTRNGLRLAIRNRCAVENWLTAIPGLKQPWVLGRNRFAVNRPSFVRKI
jgi:hypothetical protein